MSAERDAGRTAAWSSDAHTPGLPSGGECHLWLLRTDQPDWTRFDILDEDERRRATSFVRVGDRRRYLAAHVGTRLILGRYLRRAPDRLRFDRSCANCGAQHGKPRLLEPTAPLHFSYSHSGHFVLLAVAACPVGADVQVVDSGVEVGALLRSVLAVPEISAFSALPPAVQRHAFFVYWARKEALLKATGDGLRTPMTELVVSGADEPATLLHWDGRPEVPLLRLADVPVGDGYTAAVASATERFLAIERFTLDV